MIDQDTYCMDVITQTLAIQKSLSSLNRLILENHVRTHVQQMFTAGDVDTAVAELLEVYELTKVRGN